MVVAVVVVVTGIAAPAAAQQANAQAEILFREGRRLMAAGNIAEACAAFEQSQALDAAVTTLLNLAACREKLDQLATAWGLFLDAERQTRSGRDRSTVQLNKTAQERAVRLEPLVPKLTISVSDKSRIEGLQILRGTEAVPQVMWNRAMPVDGGTYTITARAPGAAEWTLTITLAPSSDAKVVDVPDLRSPRAVTEPSKPVATVAPASESLPSPTLPVDTQTQRGGRSLLLPLSLGGGAVVLFGASAGVWLWGNSTYDDAKAEMVNQSRRTSLYDSANRKRYIAQGLAVGGVACASVAVWLYFRQQDAQATRTGGLLVVPTPSGVQALLAF